MPELPEVETTCRGIAPAVLGRRIVQFTVRDVRLRRPVPTELATQLVGRTITAIGRRSKYLWWLARDDHGAEHGLMIHLGMSGSLRLCPPDTALRKHDHWVVTLAGADDTLELRYHDPRRFGLCLPLERTRPARAGAAATSDAEAQPATTLGRAPDGWTHPLWERLGPEPFDPAWTGAALYARSRGRKVAIKPFLMDATVVVGVGNIYASEALFHAGIRPGRAAGRLTRAECDRLVDAVRQVLANAIAHGGTTLRDFVREDGRHGYFAQALFVYGRAGAPCRVCGTTLTGRVIGQRASVWCPRCQR